MSFREHLTWQRLVLFLSLSFILAFLATANSRSSITTHYSGAVHNDIKAWCPLPEPPVTAEDAMADSSFLLDEATLKVQIDRLSDAVKVPTVSYDDNGDVDEDLRWEPFGELHQIFKKMFPLVYV